MDATLIRKIVLSLSGMVLITTILILFNIFYVYAALIGMSISVILFVFFSQKNVKQTDAISEESREPFSTTPKPMMRLPNYKKHRQFNYKRSGSRYIGNRRNNDRIIHQRKINMQNKSLSQKSSDINLLEHK